MTPTFVLLDFNEETVQHTGRVLENLKTKYNRKTSIEVIKKSVHHVLKQAHRPTPGYDMVYCAGIFDYLSDRICKQLMNIFYELLEPGGLLVATNVESSNPSRNGMEYLTRMASHLSHSASTQRLNPGSGSSPKFHS